MISVSSEGVISCKNSNYINLIMGKKSRGLHVRIVNNVSYIKLTKPVDR